VGTRNPDREYLPIPDNLTPEGRICFCINIPDDIQHIGAFWGALNALTRRYSWGTPLTAESEIVAAYWMQILEDNRDVYERSLEMANRGCGCDEPDLERINQDGIKEISFDAGSTWTPDLTDPRNYGTVLPLPIGQPAPDGRCSGAESITTILKKITDDLLINQGIWDTIASLIGGILAMIAVLFPGIGTAAAALLATAAYLFLLIGREALEAAMTTQVWEDFTCIVYCHINPDASLSISQWNAVKQDIVAQFDGTAEAWLWNWVNALGSTTLTNMARTLPNAAADCSACGCEACVPTIANLGNSLMARPDLGTGWWSVHPEDSENPINETNGRWFAEIELNGCCLLEDYVIVAPGINAPPGNRGHQDCQGNFGFGNYGLNGCSQFISFRTYNDCEIQFKISECV